MKKSQYIITKHLFYNYHSGVGFQHQKTAHSITSPNRNKTPQLVLFKIRERFSADERVHAHILMTVPTFIDSSKIKRDDEKEQCLLKVLSTFKSDGLNPPTIRVRWIPSDMDQN